MRTLIPCKRISPTQIRMEMQLINHPPETCQSLTKSMHLQLRLFKTRKQRSSCLTTKSSGTDPKKRLLITMLSEKIRLTVILLKLTTRLITLHSKLSTLRSMHTKRKSLKNLTKNLTPFNPIIRVFKPSRMWRAPSESFAIQSLRRRSREIT